MANQYKNKVVFNGDTLIDLSPTTATADKLVTGSGCFSASGKWIDGTLVINKYYTGTSEPSSSLGNDGDIYFQS